MSATIVAAMTRSRVIGSNNRLPWPPIKQDFLHFKALTLGKTMLMGRKTFDSIGRPLPGRQTIVLTGDLGWSHEGVTVIHKMYEIDKLLKSDDEIMVVGGGELYAMLLPFVTKIELTVIEGNFAGDTYFPELKLSDWSRVNKEQHDGFSFVTFVRKT
jgi:dihydrofolate reductase